MRHREVDDAVAKRLPAILHTPTYPPIKGRWRRSDVKELKKRK